MPAAHWAAGRNKTKNESARAQKVFWGCGGKEIFCALAFQFFFQKWNLYFVLDIIYILAYGKVFSSNVELNYL